MKVSDVEDDFKSGLYILKAKYTPHELITDFFPSGSLILVVGNPGAGKTEFLINQSIKATKHGNVLYYLNEGGDLDLQNRLNSYGLDHECAEKIYFRKKELPDFSRDEGIKKFRKEISYFKPKMVVIDPGPDAFGNENEADLIKESLQRIYHLAHKYNFCLVLSWHNSKMSSSGMSTTAKVYSFRGSSAFAGKVDLMYTLDVYSEEHVLSLVKLRQDCIGISQSQQWSIVMERFGSSKKLLFEPYKNRREKTLEKRNNILSNSVSLFEKGSEYGSTEIQSVLLEKSQGSIQETTTKLYLKELVDNGFFRKVKDHSGPRPAIYERTMKDFII